MQLETIARGVYLEGLCVDTRAIWISDPIKGGIREMRADGSKREWFAEKRWIGSLLLHTKNILLISGEGGIAWLDGTTGAVGTLIDNVGGKPLPGVNEMVADGSGGIYFGSLDVPAISRGEKTAPASLYHLDRNGHATKLITGLRFSNGIAVSPDRKKLYHNETFVGLSAYDIAADGSLSNPVMLLKKPDCDGIAVDVEGNLWITGCTSNFITCLRPDGTLKEKIELPGGGATNVRFGGADGRDVYVNTVPVGAAEKLVAGIFPDNDSSILYRGRAQVAGLQTTAPAFPL